jgi:RNA polymerase sigma factor (sigma-70 family)
MNFATLYEAHKNLVFNLALHYVNNIEDAEEITQDVFVKVYDRLSQFQANAQFKTWIYRITINQSIDFLKAKQRKKRFFLNSLWRVQDEHFPEHSVLDHQHPGIVLENKEAVTRILNAVQQLPDNQKSVIILLKIQALSQQEVATIMNISIKAVESLLQRAKRNLDKILNNSEG